MKKIYFVGLMVFLIINIYTMAFTAEKEQTKWKQILQFGTSHRINTVGFIDETTGISCGADGECHYTLDAGKTWPKAENNSACRFAMDIIDKDLIWNTGNGGQVRTSRDCGKTWSAVTDFGGRGDKMSFLDAQTGWIFGYDGVGLVRTTDGGNTWQQVITQPFLDVSAIALLTPNEGFLLVSGNELHYTKDNGESWTIIKTNLPTDLKMPAMRFLDSNRAMVVGYSPEQQKVFSCVTNDGGKTWSRQTIHDGYGTPYLSRDTKLLTLFNFSGTVTVYQQY